MGKYVCLVKFTHEGLKKLNATTKRADAFKTRIEEQGAKIITTLWTIGHYDLIHIFEAPDEVTAARLTFSLNSLGNVTTETLRAYDAEEMEQILDGLVKPYDLIRE